MKHLFDITHDGDWVLPKPAKTPTRLSIKSGPTSSWSLGMNLETLWCSQIRPSTSSFVGGTHHDVVYTTLARLWCPMLCLHGQGLASPACSGCFHSGMRCCISIYISVGSDESWLLFECSAKMEDVWTVMVSGSDRQAFLLFTSLLSRGREGPPVKQQCHCHQHCGSPFPGLAGHHLALWGGIPSQKCDCRCLRRLDSLQMVKRDQLCSNIGPCELQMVRHPVQWPPLKAPRLVNSCSQSGGPCCNPGKGVFCWQCSEGDSSFWLSCWWGFAWNLLEWSPLCRQTVFR